MFEIIQYSFDKLGSYSPFILFLKNIWVLNNKPTYLGVYIIGYFLDIVINVVLKGIIQEPRPDINLKLFNTSNTYFRRFIFHHGIPYDLYGMPSGHVQNVFYSTTYAMLVLKNRKNLYLDLLVCFITFFQRINGNLHTLFQTFIGAIVGIITGYIFYWVATRKLVGNLKLKDDDSAPK
jgi:membrane-associated phospholipid phosphatase